VWSNTYGGAEREGINWRSKSETSEQSGVDRNNENKNRKRCDIITGNTDNIFDWLDEVNHMSYRNQRIHNDLGIIVPLCLEGTAKNWFHALDPQIQNQIQRSWGGFKLALTTYFMNQQWFDRMKMRVLRMCYRQKGYESETPSDYFHRKYHMIQEVFVQTPSETIMEIMNGAP
jgi:hypothetical protein